MGRFRRFARTGLLWGVGITAVVNLGYDLVVYARSGMRREYEMFRHNEPPDARVGGTSSLRIINEGVAPVSLTGIWFGDRRVFTPDGPRVLGDGPRQRRGYVALNALTTVSESVRIELSGDEDAEPRIIAFTMDRRGPRNCAATVVINGSSVSIEECKPMRTPPHSD